MIVVVIALFGLISMEVWMWALFYYQIGFLKSFETALYFSTVTFSTIGYGDIVPDERWRLLAALEGINGFLLIGWSTAYLVAAGIRIGPFRPGEHF
jgi:voltage-gated potassium channel Kch